MGRASVKNRRPINVISDPPFSRMDLISCRNLLIYLEPELQKRVFPVFLSP
jgi:two-component system CheB/CheR fusion protein